MTSLFLGIHCLENDTNLCIIVSIYIFLAITVTICKTLSVESSTQSFVSHNVPSKNTSFQMQHFTSYLGEEVPIKAYHLDIQYQPTLSKTELLAIM